ncbi:hypothetical protein AB6735_23545 [Mucilaginibacter sp. RCC_168]|uniref:hypothetical protein n=1 Tax=Mucilaginibacter sp. RCC_168 TaxID=3239221 RepID=UPI00352317BE
MKLLIILIFISTFITACNFKKNDISKSEADQPWNELTIIDDHRIVTTINNDNDSSIVRIYHTGSIFTPRPKKLVIDTLKAWFTKSEKDTLAYLTKEIILNPISTTNYCTEFVGSVEMKISYGQFKLSGEYDSVCDWTILSDRTKKLNSILQRQLKTLKVKQE